MSGPCDAVRNVGSIVVCVIRVSARLFVSFCFVFSDSGSQDSSVVADNIPHSDI